MIDDDAGELIRRCRAGEAEAQQQLFERYRRYLWLLAEVQLGKHLRAKCDASDIVQLTMLEAHRDFGAFTGQHEGDLLAWLRRILAHNIYNEARYHNAKQRAHNREVSLDQVHAGLESSAMTLGQRLAVEQPSPSESAARHEGALHLAEALSKLPADYQKVILLRIFDGLSAEEVANQMDRTAGAVRMLQLRALTALREEMDKHKSQ